jgi:hypothetical protein
VNTPRFLCITLQHDFHFGGSTTTNITPSQHHIIATFSPIPQCDALGSMVQLQESHFKSMHTFRLEWQPGADGYLRWYMDGKFRYGIEQVCIRINIYLPLRLTWHYAPANGIFQPQLLKAV